MKIAANVKKNMRVFYENCDYAIEINIDYIPEHQAKDAHAGYGRGGKTHPQKLTARAGKNKIAKMTYLLLYKAFMAIKNLDIMVGKR